MYTRTHALVSTVLGVVLTVTTASADPVVLVVVTIVAGTAIDLDHFLVARVQTGSWEAVRRGLSDPSRLLVHQSELFERGEVGVLHRLLSHVVFGGVAVGTVYTVATPLTLPVALGLYTHVLTDLIADVSRVDGVVLHAADR